VQGYGGGEDIGWERAGEDVGEERGEGAEGCISLAL
jgi:hypothetical protein